MSEAKTSSSEEVPQGSPESVRIWIEKLVINNGSEIRFEPDDIVVVIGPNNSGKSTLLREVRGRAVAPLSQANIVNQVTMGKTGRTEDLIALLQTIAFTIDKTSGDDHYTYYRGQVHQSSAQMHWQEMNALGLQSLDSMFIRSLSADSRTNISASAPSFDRLNEVASLPLHIMFADDSEEAKICNLFKQVFNVDLTLNRASGKKLYLHVGERPTFTDGEHPASTSYFRKLQAIPTLDEQGDGMRSFVGLMLEVLLGNHTIVFVDEPEVFLHPPQGRMVGRMLAENIPTGKQLFFATHSEDFLKGLLELNTDRVKILRITRNGTNNQIRELSKADLKRAWSFPLLRHSNMLSGLFYNGVVLCEADMDCQFFSAILDSIYDQYLGDNGTRRVKVLDLLFIHCGGKHRMPTVIDALIKVGVPVTVVCDFDVLDDINPMEPIFKSLGGDWRTIEKDWNIVKKSIDTLRPELELDKIRFKVNEILAREKGPALDPKSAEEIKKLLKRSSPWQTAKSSGKSIVPSGDATNAFNRLTDVLEGTNFFIVDVGEIESFDKTEGGHGPQWLAKVLEKDINSEHFTAARTFVKRFTRISNR